jgi:hypothetical protein
MTRPKLSSSLLVCEDGPRLTPPAQRPPVPTATELEEIARLNVALNERVLANDKEGAIEIYFELLRAGRSLPEIEDLSGNESPIPVSRGSAGALLDPGYAATTALPKLRRRTIAGLSRVGLAGAIVAAASIGVLLMQPAAKKTAAGRPPASGATVDAGAKTSPTTQAPVPPATTTAAVGAARTAPKSPSTSEAKPAQTTEVKPALAAEAEPASAAETKLAPAEGNPAQMAEAKPASASVAVLPPPIPSAPPALAASPVPTETNAAAAAPAPPPAPSVAAPAAPTEPAAPPQTAAAVAAPTPSPAPASPVPAATPPPASSTPVSPLAGTAPAPKTPPDQPRLAAAEIAALLARGDSLLEAGDIVSARLFYERASDARNGRAALRLGATYDPSFLDRVHLSRYADAAQALAWYRRARDLGESGAELWIKGLDIKPGRQ